MAEIISAAQAAELIHDGDSIVFAADGLVCFPNEIVDAVEQRFLREHHPAGITSIRAAGMGNWGDAGEAHWCHDGMITRAINSYMSVCPPLCHLVEENKIQGYMFPLGPIMQLFREIGRGMPGILSKVGLGTFADARKDGGKLNRLTMEQGADFVKYIPDFEGEDYLWYTLPKLNVALLRASSADPHGNLSIDREAEEIELLSVAQAVKASGGIVICQVDEMVDLHTVNPHMIKVPGIYVDYIVVAENYDEIPQNMARKKGVNYEPAFTGEVLKEISPKTVVVPLDERKVIARRAAMELKAGDNVNMGLGMPTTVPVVLAEAGVDHMITMISETGTIGGVPGTERLDFGCHWNAEAFSDHGEHFSFFDGGCLDCGVFGLSEVDRDGNMNTSHLNGKITGVGGFTDISTNAKKVLFIGTFTAVGLKTEVKDGTIHILQEGKYKKFVEECKKVSFVASEYLKKHDSLLYITERCVIRRTKEGMILEEIAPGIDIKTQILDLCDGEIIIPEGGPRLMDPRLFAEEPMKLDW
ncbi:MAG: malonate decarboxylase subunit alpha [Anaerovoracaceae bacterium]